MASSTLIFDILARDHASKTLDQISRKVNGLTTVAKAVGGAFAAAGAKAFAQGAIEQARESIKVQQQTNAVLKSTAGQAGITGKEISGLADRLSNLAGVDDELIQSGENVLLTFTKVRNEAGKGNDVFNQATGLALDMSKALGTDLQGSILQVGKALQDPVRGMTALRRAGVSFTKEQQDQVKALVASGDQLGAQKLILAELRKEFGGSAAAQSTSADRMRVAWENLQETVGKKLIPIMEALSKFLVDHQRLIVPLAAVIGGVLVAAFVAWARAAVVAAADTVAAMASAAAAAATAAVEFLLVFGPIILIGAAVAALAVVVVKNWDTIKNAVGAAVNFVKEHLDLFLLALGPIGVGIILLRHNWETVWGAIQKVIQTAWDVIRPIIKAITSAIDKVGGAVGKVTGAIGKVGGVVGGAVHHIPGFADGGVMPGPIGVHSLAWVAGGETILPTHKQDFALGGSGVTVNVDARGIEPAPAVGEYVSRFVGWKLSLVGGD